MVDGKQVLNFCSNNYLGLANHPRLVQAAKDSHRPIRRRPGGGAHDRRHDGLHLELERRLAAFKGVEAAITFQSGFSANLGAIPALVGKEDVIYSDELNHASIIDGCRLSGATHRPLRPLRPGRPATRDRGEQGHGYRRALIITDGVFSMDGDIAPLDKIYEVAQEYDYLLMVDDAHGEGVLGKGGRGIVDHFGLHGKVDIEVGTLSKAFGVVGGVVAGKPVIVDWLRQRGRPFLFSSAMTVPDVAACLAAVDLLEASTELVDRLWENAELLQARDAGPGLRHRSEHDAHHADHAWRGAAGAAVQPRAVRGRRLCHGHRLPDRARGKARIRVMISAAHSREDLERGLWIFERVGKELGVI